MTQLQLPEIRVNATGKDFWDPLPQEPWGILHFPHFSGGRPLSPQLLEIQADYHRRSLTSLDTALAELRDNHSQSGGDMSKPASYLLR